MPKYTNDAFSDLRKLLGARLNELHGRLTEPTTRSGRLQIRLRISEIERLWLRFMVAGLDAPKIHRRAEWARPDLLPEPEPEAPPSPEDLPPTNPSPQEPT